MTQREILKELRSSGGWMLMNQYRKTDGKEPFPTIDLGPVGEAESAYREISGAGIPKAFFRIEGGGRLIVGIPPKHAHLLSDPRVSDKPTYWNITHSWRYPNATTVSEAEGDVVYRCEPCNRTFVTDAIRKGLVRCGGNSEGCSGFMHLVVPGTDSQGEYAEPEGL